MSGERKVVKRGNYAGLMYEVDHLATFTVGPKQGKLFWALEFGFCSAQN